MGFTNGHDRASGALSPRGAAWAAGSAVACVLIGANLLLTLIIAIIAYVKGS